MSFAWEALDNGYRAQIKLDMPAGSVVYSTNSTMAQLHPLPGMTATMHIFGDTSSANVIVVGKDEKYL